MEPDKALDGPTPPGREEQLYDLQIFPNTNQNRRHFPLERFLLKLVQLN